MTNDFNELILHLTKQSNNVKCQMWKAYFAEGIPLAPAPEFNYLYADARITLIKVSGNKQTVSSSF